MNSYTRRLFASFTIVAVSGLTACGGGSSSSASASAVTFSGTAATGAAMANATVSISCVGGSGTATTAANGTYSASISGVSTPCVIRATSSDGATVLYSVVAPSASASTTQVANITPLTQLLVASLSGTDPAAFYAAFSSTTASSVTASSVSAAQTAVLTTLTNAGLDVSSLSNLLSGALVAATSTTGGNAYDAALDALKAKLTSSGTTLASLTTTVAAASPASTTSTTGSNAPSLPAAQLLKTADSNCSALRSGDYWVVKPTKNSTIASQFASASYDATTKTALNFVASSAAFTDNGPCQYSSTGSSTIVVSQAGIVVMRFTDSADRIGLAFPKQTLAVSDLAGNWSSLNFEFGGSTYTGASATATVSATGALSNVIGCDGAVTASTCTPSTDAQAFQLNSDGGFDLVDSTDSTTSRAFAYRAGSGSLTIVVVDPDGSVAFFTKQRTLSLPTVGTISPKSWSFRANNALVANAFDASSIGFTTTIISVDPTTSSYVRSQNLVDGTANYNETLLINNPRIGYNFRAAAPNVTTSTGTMNLRERTSLGLAGSGLSVQSLPASPVSFQVTVDQP